MRYNLISRVPYAWKHIVLTLLSLTICIAYFSSQYGAILGNRICSESVRSRNHLISFGSYTSNECRAIGGCLSRFKTCLSEETWPVTVCPNEFEMDVDQRSMFPISEKMNVSETTIPCGPKVNSKIKCLERHCCFSRQNNCILPGPKMLSMPERIRFSIVLSCYPDCELLAESMKSVFSQSYVGWELIVACPKYGNSKCFHKVRSAKAKLLRLHKRVRKSQIQVYFYNGEDPSTFKNFAAHRASGTYLRFMTSNEIISSNYFRDALLQIKEDNDIIVLYGDQIILDKKGESKLWITAPLQSLEEVVKKFHITPLPMPFIVKRSSFRDVEGFSTDLVHGLQDFDIWLKLLRLQARDKSMKLRKFAGPRSWTLVHSISFLTKMRSPKSISLSMVRLKHHTLFKNICSDLSFVFCDEYEATISKLERSVFFNRNSCFPYVILALLRSGHACDTDTITLLGESERNCDASEDKVHHDDSYEIFLKIKPLINEKLLKPISNQSHRTCRRKFLYLCERVSKFEDRYPDLYPSNEEAEAYLPYYSTNADNLFQSFTPLQSMVKSSVQSYANAKSITKGVPNIFHFVFGFQAGAEELDFYHFVSIISAIARNNPKKVYFHCPGAPSGKWWDKVKNFLTVKVWTKTAINAPRCLTSYAHTADLVRLLALYQFGGVYIDMDIISIRKINRSINSEFGISVQNSPRFGTSREKETYYGLCNAVMMSVPKSKFLKTWIETYKYFRSLGHDNSWDEHSVRLPADIVDKYINLQKNGYVSKIDPLRYWSILWNETPKFLERFSDCSLDCHRRKWPHSEVFHLWTSIGNNTYIDILKNENLVKKYKHSLLYAISLDSKRFILGGKSVRRKENIDKYYLMSFFILLSTCLFSCCRSLILKYILRNLKVS